MSYETCVQNEEEFRYFTGLTPGQFLVIYDLIGGDNVCSQLKYKGDNSPQTLRPKKKISFRSRLFLVLVRMRRDLSLHDIAQLMGIGFSTASIIFTTWVRHLSVTFQEIMPHMAVSAKQQNKNKPLCFAPYKNLRMIIDCVEFPLERSANLQQQSNTFSDYKHGNTGKALVGISAHGGVSFVSPCYEGRISDKEIVLKSGLMDILEKGDSVMADRGFRVEEEMKKIGVTLIKPPDKPRQSAHLTARQEVQTKSIASVRIYVEHVIGKIKDWLILAHRVEKLNIIYLEDLVYIAAFLYNFTRIYIGQEKGEQKEQPKKKKETNLD